MDSRQRHTRGIVDVERCPISRSISVRDLVLRPFEAVVVFPCIGSQIQPTRQPSERTASSKRGRPSAMRLAPKRWISVKWPGSLAGFKIRQSRTRSSGFVAGPTFIPIGF